MEPIYKYTEEQQALADDFADFVKTELLPNLVQWEHERDVPREIYNKMGERGFLCRWVDEQYGGMGHTDMSDGFVLLNTANKLGVNWNGWSLHSEVVGSYIQKFGTEEMKQDLLPKMISGEKLICVMMTEPDHGSDLSTIESTAVRDGDEYVINAHKCFITNGTVSDYAVLAAVTDPEAKPGKGISLILIDLHDPAIKREQMHKLGFHIQDIGEIWIENLRVPVTNLLGEENKGYSYLMGQLQHERLVGAYNAQGMCERALELAAEYAKERIVFGTPLYKKQNANFTLADMYAETIASRALVDACTIQYLEGKTTNSDISACKVIATETAFKVVERAFQIMGGHALCYEDEELSRLYFAIRQTRIAGGTTEIQKLLVSRAV